MLRNALKPKHEHQLLIGWCSAVSERCTETVSDQLKTVEGPRLGCVSKISSRQAFLGKPGQLQGGKKRPEEHSKYSKRTTFAQHIKVYRQQTGQAVQVWHQIHREKTTPTRTMCPHCSRGPACFQMMNLWQSGQANLRSVHAAVCFWWKPKLWCLSSQWYMCRCDAVSQA